MGLLFMDGFDHYENADVYKKWTTGSSTFSVNGGQISPAWSRSPGGCGLKLGDGWWINKNFANTASFVAGSYFNFGSVGGNFWFALKDGGTEQVSVRVDGNWHLTFTRNGTVLATSTNTIVQNTWYHIEMKCTIHNTAGAYEVRVNGSSVGWIPPTINANTRATANNYINQVEHRGNNGNGVAVDDTYVLDANADFVGPSKIIALTPTKAGNYAQWTPNWMQNFANVRERTGDLDGTFNQSATAGQIDTFGFENVQNATIVALQHCIMARQDAGVARSIAPITRVGTTDYVGTTFSTPGSYVYVLDVSNVNPATSVAWLYTDINSAEFGYKLIG